MNEVQINFASWLVSKKYAYLTIDAYPYWLDSRIIKAFNIPDLKNISEIEDIDVLESIEKKFMSKELTKTEKDLRSALRKFIEFRKSQNIIDENINLEIVVGDQLSFTEGGRKVVISHRIERNKKLRDEAIRIHKLNCQVCDFNFEENYGELGIDYIEVHHVVPLSKDYSPKITNPKTDLNVVCSNCHRMIHKKRNITLSIDELKTKLKNKTTPIDSNCL